MDFITFCKNLSSENWNKKVNKDWTVKDVIAHLVGWEKEVAVELSKAWVSKKQPWFWTTNNYDEFNKKSVDFYKNFSTDELISEWQKWQDAVELEINKIGESNLRKDPNFS